MKNNKPKFTPGPWIVIEHPEAKASQRFLIREKNATVNIGAAFDINLANAKANAHLIAASPEMYEMLHTLQFELLGINPILVREIGDLLAKARGEQ